MANAARRAVLVEVECLASRGIDTGSDLQAEPSFLCLSGTGSPAPPLDAPAGDRPRNRLIVELSPSRSDLAALAFGARRAGPQASRSGGFSRQISSTPSCIWARRSSVSRNKNSRCDSSVGKAAYSRAAS